MGDREEPWSAIERSREGATLVTEELARQEVARQRRTIDLDIWGAAPAAELLEGAGDQLLAGSPLNADEDGGVGASHQLDPSLKIADGGAPADDPVKRPKVAVRHPRPAPASRCLAG